jgi:ParB family chromosome partitioning protein
VPRRSGLGRGLAALIPTEAVGERGSTLREVPIASVKPSRFQPRRRFDEDSMAQLAASIREVGVLQPVLVRELEPGEYELVAGERRWRAARRAGLQLLPAIVQVVPDASSLEQALVENLHREDLTPLEEAAGFQQLIEDFALTHEELARRVGKSRAAVTNSLRLFQLPPSVQRLVADRLLSAGHARALLGTPDRELQERLAARAVEEGLSVRVVENIIRSEGERDSSGEVEGSARESHAPGLAPSGRGEQRAALRPPGTLELEELLAAHLDTRVRVEIGGRRGRVVVEFATLDDLERIYRLMIAGKPPSDGPAPTGT